MGSQTVTRVMDGDTIDVSLDGESFRVRYIGLNTPENDMPCYTEALDANAALVEGQTVTLVRDVSDTDAFGRLLRYVYVDGTFVNAALIGTGWAEAQESPPDTTHQELFNALDSDARTAGVSPHAIGVFD